MKSWTKELKNEQYILGCSFIIVSFQQQQKQILFFYCPFLLYYFRFTFLVHKLMIILLNEQNSSFVQTLIILKLDSTLVLAKQY